MLNKIVYTLNSIPHIFIQTLLRNYESFMNVTFPVCRTGLISASSPGHTPLVTAEVCEEYILYTREVHPATSPRPEMKTRSLVARSYTNYFDKTADT